MSNAESEQGVARRALLLSIALGIGALLLGYAASRAILEGNDKRPDGLLWPNPKRLKAFQLETTKGRSLDPDELAGQWTMMFFGFTSCPDVCPTTLATMQRTMERLRETDAADGVTVVFVSVDPARDSLAQIRRYVEYFDTDFVGATAPLERLDALTSQLAVFHDRGKPDPDGNYQVNHTASVLLIDPQVRFVGVLPPHSAQEIVEGFKAIRAYLERQG